MLTNNFSLLPLYNLNSRLESGELQRQIGQLHEKGVQGFIMVPWMELEQEYLSPEYFSMVKVILGKARSLGMKVIIWDEYGWPTGQIAGHFQVRHPEYKMRHLRYDVINVPGKTSLRKKVNAEDFLAAFAKDGSGAMYRPEYSLSGGLLRCRLKTHAAKVYLFYSQVTEIVFDGSVGAPWTTGKPGLLNMLDRDAVETFLEESYGLYRKHVGKYFGNTLAGFFTDEPCCHMNIVASPELARKEGYEGLMTHMDAPSLPWTPGFERIFERTYGYCLTGGMIELVDRTDNGIKLRQDYWNLVSTLYTQNFHRSVKNWCSENGLLYTGHLFQEAPIAKQVKFQANIFEALKSFDVPGYDHLRCGVVTRCSPAPEEGNPFTAKLVTSAAKLLRKKRTLVEVYSAAPWSIKISEMKKSADWDAFLGANMFVPVVCYSIGTITHMSHPSNFHQMPAWKHYRAFADYMERLSGFMAVSDECTDTGVLYPWSAIADSADMGGRQSGKFLALERAVLSTVNTLLEKGRDFDFLFEEIVKHSVAKNGTLDYRGFRYGNLIVPSAFVISPGVLEKLEKFAAAGGVLIFLGKVPAHFTGGTPVPKSRLRSFPAKFASRAPELPGMIGHEILHFPGAPVKSAGIMLKKRRFKGKTCFLLMNTREKAVRAEVKSRAHFEMLDFAKGITSALQTKASGHSYRTFIDLAPGELKVIRETSKPVQATAASRLTPCRSIRGPVGGWRFRAEGRNYLPLCDWRVDGSRRKYRMMPSGCDPARKHRISADFHVAAVPGEMLVYIEKKSFSNCRVNGKTLGRKHLRRDIKAFDVLYDVFDISAAVKKGRNTLDAACRIPGHILGISKSQAYFCGKPTTIIRRAILAGGFSLSRNEEIVSPRGKISCGDWTRMGWPYFSGTGVYSGDLRYTGRSRRVLIEIECFGDCAEIFINGKHAGLLFCEPYRCEITPLLRQGVNVIDIHVTNTISNAIAEKTPSGLKSVRFLCVGRSPALRPAGTL